MKVYRYIVALSCLLLVGLNPAAGQDNTDDYIRAHRLGITHISSATAPTPTERYEQALALGAGWNRWPLYWDRVQDANGLWDWAAYDRQVIDDLKHGLNINAILIGVPAAYRSGDSIAGINEPIFSDGTDIPSPDKTLNPENPWVRFVFAAVTRYKPGGALSAQAEALPQGAGIRVWEIWNEPDFEVFWRGGIRDYARLLKISYIAIKMADPDAQVMVGGLLYPTQDNWLAQILRVYNNDPQAANFNWYMDIVAVHNYADPWRSGWLTLYARETLDAYDLERPIWLNETGVPVWDDYPGPVWDSNSLKYATSQQQAWFFIQSAAYAWSEGADKVFYHQLYDDCGDQPAGSDFPPHGGEFCTAGQVCYGDAHGMFRNLPGGVCFSQHPEPGTPRPVAAAYRLMAEIFGQEAFVDGDRVWLDESVVSITFQRPLTDERITVMWNRTFRPVTFDYEAVGENGQLVSLASSQVIAPNSQGNFTIDLPPALPDNVPNPPEGADSGVGGPPYIVIEQIGGRVDEQPIRPSEGVPTIRLDDSVGDSAEVASIPPTTPPDPTIVDTEPPSARVLPLPATSPPTFTVTWTGEDDSGIDYYLVWVRVNDEDWLPWVETDQTSMDYTGSPGNTYAFAAWAVDIAGNWSEDSELFYQAGTVVE